MATTEKDFRVKRGLIVGQDATIGGTITGATINATTINATTIVGDGSQITNTSIASIDDIGNVVLTSPANGQVLKYNGTNWVNGTDSTTVSNIDNIGDVVITSPASGQILKYDAGNWINDQLTFEKQYTQTGTLTVGDAGVRWYPGTNVNIRSVVARVTTAPIGSAIVVAIKVNGSAVQSVTIDDSTYASLLVSTSIGVNYSYYVTIGVTQIGSSVAGSDLTVTLNYTRA